MATQKMTAREMLEAFQAEMTAKLQELAAAADAEEKAAAEKAQRLNARIDRAQAEIDGRIARLQERRAKWEALRIVQEAPAVQAPAPAQPKTDNGRLPATAVAGATKKYQTEKYMFWKAYQRAYKGLPRIEDHSQAVLSATCKAHNIDQAISDVATLQRVHDLVCRTLPCK
jgi:hypothetical protein